MKGSKFLAGLLSACLLVSSLPVMAAAVQKISM